MEKGDFFFQLFKTRLNRRNFFLGYIISILVLIFSYLWLTVSFSDNGIPGFSVFGVVTLIILSIINLVFLISLCLRRVHDIGLSGWYLLLALVPFFGQFFQLYLIFAPGKTAPNIYGEIPNPEFDIKGILASR